MLLDRAIGEWRSARRWLVGASVAAFLQTVASTARAQVELHWSAPESCPQESDVRARIQSLAGASLAKAERLRAEGIIAREGERFRLTLRVFDGNDVRQRVIDSDSCADLSGAAAVALTLLLGEKQASQPDGTTRGSDTTGPGQNAAASGGDRGQPGAKPETRPQPEERSDAPEDEPATESGERAWRVLLRAPVAALDVGPLPRPSPNFGLSAGMKFATWRVLIGAHVSLGQRITSPVESDIGADLERRTAWFSTCRGFGSAQFELSPCLVLALEDVRARGFGRDVESQSARAIFLAPGAGATAHLHISDFLSLFVGTSAQIELARPRVVIRGVGEIDELLPASLSVSLGAEWIL
jgi:hypothetical protein